MKKRKILTGKVVSDKNNKTIIVNIQRRFPHPFFKKIIKKTNKLHVHDEKNKYKIGDIVKISQCKPTSKKKRYEVVEEQK